MEKRTSAFTRLLAVLALAGAVVVVIVAISSSLGGDSDSSKKSHGANHGSKQHSHRTKASSYVVETGDTLTSIAHETGVPVAQILKLNPEVDPQILIAGEKLKLR
jgi:LysM repeat protein